MMALHVGPAPRRRSGRDRRLFRAAGDPGERRDRSHEGRDRLPPAGAAGAWRPRRPHSGAGLVPGGSGARRARRAGRMAPVAGRRPRHRRRGPAPRRASSSPAACGRSPRAAGLLRLDALVAAGRSGRRDDRRRARVRLGRRRWMSGIDALPAAGSRRRSGRGAGSSFPTTAEPGPRSRVLGCRSRSARLGCGHARPRPPPWRQQDRAPAAVRFDDAMASSSPAPLPLGQRRARELGSALPAAAPRPRAARKPSRFQRLHNRVTLPYRLAAAFRGAVGPSRSFA